jgi:predicted transcriptional regulator
MEKHTVTRRNEILKLLSKDESLKTSDLAEIFGVTTETIRKDLLYLQDKGVVQKLHGRAKLSRTSSDTPIDIRTLQMQNEKIKFHHLYRWRKHNPGNRQITLQKRRDDRHYHLTQCGKYHCETK